MIGIGNDNSGHRRRFGELPEPWIRQRNWIHNINTGVCQNRAGEEVNFCGRIVGLPDPEAGQKLIEIGRRHRWRMAETEGVGKGVAL